VFKIIRSLIATLIAVSSSLSSACPCGCGAINPQVLEPGEKWKYAVGVTNDSNFEVVKKNGELGRDGGPETVKTMTFAVARAVDDSLSTTVSLLAHQNTHSEEESDYSTGDPSVSVRWTALPQTFARPWSPKIQLFSTYKQSFARSANDGSERTHQMDIHGNGFSEFVPGVDIWFGMTAIKMGISQILIVPLEKKFTNDSYSVTVKPGAGERTTVSIGHTLVGFGTIVGSVDRETRQRMQVNKEEIEDSETLVNSLTIATSFKAGFRKTVGFSFKRTAALATNKNTTRADSMTMAYMQAL
jgi:hypothetical protein